MLFPETVYLVPEKNYMKKIICIAMAGALIVSACNKKSVPSTSGTSGSSSSTSSTSSKEESKSTSVVTTKTDAQNQADLEAKRKEEQRQAEQAKAAAPEKPSDEVSGQNIYTTKCAKCHGAKPVGNWTFNQWEGILKSMVPKAKLNADEESQLIAYIKAHAK